MSKSKGRALQTLIDASIEELSYVQSEDVLTQKLQLLAKRCSGVYDSFEGRRYILLKKCDIWLEYELKGPSVVIYKMNIDGVIGWCMADGRQTRWRYGVDSSDKDMAEIARQVTHRVRNRERQRIEKELGKGWKRRMQRETAKVLRSRLREQREQQPEVYTSSPAAKDRDFQQDIPSAQRIVDKTKTCRTCANRGGSSCPNGGMQVCELWLEKQDVSGYWPV